MRIAGVDEAGRGPLAGPVFAAAVVLTDSQREELVAMGLRDSKKMTPRRRDQVFCAMMTMKVAYGVAAASPAQIDKMNILRATLWCMRRAVEKVPGRLDGVRVDGNQSIPDLDLFQQVVIGGDDQYAEISAASVIAKVCRDRWMIALARRYPEWGFDRHKGYGTKAHRDLLRQFGPLPCHRRSFSWGI